MKELAEVFKGRMSGIFWACPWTSESLGRRSPYWSSALYTLQEESHRALYVVCEDKRLEVKIDQLEDRPPL